MARAQIILGDENFITMNLLGRCPSDKSCLRVKLTARVYSLRCSCETSLGLQALSKFRDQIETMNTDLAGAFSITFNRDEVIQGSVNHHGHIVVSFDFNGTRNSQKQRLKDDGQWKASGFFVSHPDILTRTAQ